jgi:SAM-dependent methyltransferase
VISTSGVADHRLGAAVAALAAARVTGVESVNFDRAAGYYDATRALPEQAMADLLAALRPELAARQPCLEIGVGTGRIALPLHGQGIRLAGADIAEAMLRRLVANADGVRPFPLLRADATALPLAGASFGSVLAVHVLHLIPAWQRAVDEAVRVLRSGGALVAAFPGADANSRRQARTAAWRPAFREACARHGVVRVRMGASTPAEVSEHLGDRATARMLPPVRVAETQALGRAVRDLEEQRYSWTWPHSREQVLAAGADIRAWAARENVSLDEEHPVEATLEWWLFELPA